MPLSHVRLPNHAHAREKQDDQQLKHKDLEEHRVHQTHHVANLRRKLFLVHHDLGVLAHINWHSDNVLSIA